MSYYYFPTQPAFGGPPIMIRKILEGKNPVKKNKVINKKMGGASEERVDQRLVWFNQGFRAGLCSLIRR